MPLPEPILEVRDLSKQFQITRGLFQPKLAIRAVDGISFAVSPGQTFGLVGESGCGKSTTGRCLLRLQPITSGEVKLLGREVAQAPLNSLAWLRREAQIIFQDPYNSLNPRMRVGQLVAEPMALHGVGTVAQRWEHAEEMMRLVGLDRPYLKRFPKELSGGQRQRVCIARALVLRPKLVICDEPVSALDVSVQAQVMELLLRLQEQMGLTYLFISHDLAVVRQVSHQVGVMYLGKLVEVGPAETVLTQAVHPYTQALLAAVPRLNPFDQQRRATLRGDVPSIVRPPSGCRFHTRCPYAESVCRSEEPVMRPVGDEHSAACHLVRTHESAGVQQSSTTDGVA